MVFNNKTGSLFLKFNWRFLKTQQTALHSLLKYGLIVALVASSAIATPTRWDHRRPTLNTHEQSRANFKSLKAFILESFRFEDENDYEYEIFSILSIARAWTSLILAGKPDSHRHRTTSLSVNVVVAGTSYQMLEVYHFAMGRELNLLQ